MGHFYGDLERQMDWRAHNELTEKKASELDKKCEAWEAGSYNGFWVLIIFKTRLIMWYSIELGFNDWNNMVFDFEKHNIYRGVIIYLNIDRLCDIYGDWRYSYRIPVENGHVVFSC